MAKKIASKQPVQANVKQAPKSNSQPDNKRMILAAGAVLIGIIMAIISWMILPESVATQFKGMSTGAPAVPKIVAVAIPLVITVVGVVQALKLPEAFKICLVGYVANILFWISNM